MDISKKTNDRNQLCLIFSEVGIFSEKEKEQMLKFEETLKNKNLLFMKRILNEEFQDGGLPYDIFENYLENTIVVVYKEDNEKVINILKTQFNETLPRNF